MQFFSVIVSALKRHKIFVALQIAKKIILKYGLPNLFPAILYILEMFECTIDMQETGWQYIRTVIVFKTCSPIPQQQQQKHP